MDVEAVSRGREKSGGTEARQEEAAVALCGAEKHTLLEDHVHVFHPATTSKCVVLNIRQEEGSKDLTQQARWRLPTFNAIHNLAVH